MAPLRVPLGLTLRSCWRCAALTNRLGTVVASGLHFEGRSCFVCRCAFACATTATSTATPATLGAVRADFGG